MFSGSLLFSKPAYAVYTVVLLCLFHSCNASYCGLHNISYPFRLKTDPKDCGVPQFELDCHNNLTLTVDLDSVKYNVQAINYDNGRIRVVDANVQRENCSSIPLYSLQRPKFWYRDDFVIYYSSTYLRQTLVFVKCESRVNSPLYVDRSICNHNSSSSNLGAGFSYVIVDSISASDMVDSCFVELITLTSLLLPKDGNISYFQVHDSLLYGFEMYWSIPDHQDYHSLLMITQYVYNGVLELLQHIGFGRMPAIYIAGLPGLLFYRFPIWLFYLLQLLYDLLLFPALYRLTLFIFGAPIVIAFLIYKWRRRHQSMFSVIEEFLQRDNHLMPIRYSYSDIKKMTKGFKDKLGEGGFGCVYKGKLRSGSFIAVKMMDKSKSDGDDFISEVATIGKIHHVNIVRLIGFCVEGSKRALIYEYMMNGSLDKHIFSQEGSNDALSIEKMYEISLGVAHGIDYLHRGCDMQILHFDIKPHNILLNEKFMPKISDFGLAKLYPTNKNTVSLTKARGTMGYMAPELLFKNIGGVSYKSDIYSFGMLLMEMAGRRKNLNAFIENVSQIYFPSWAYDKLCEGTDIELGNATEEERKITTKMILVALWCIQLSPADRPSMHEVIEMLEGEIERITMPPRPSLTPGS